MKFALIGAALVATAALAQSSDPRNGRGSTA
jgi:hypothetical protein